MATRLVVFDKYEVIRRLAAGGMGEIYLARQIGAAGFHRLVVLKSLKPELAERSEFLAQFLNEARTAARLNHPNVVAVYDVDEYRGVYFLAMEYIRGSDLAALGKAAAAAGQRLPQRLAAAIAHDAALGLHHAHQASDEQGQRHEIVHRDVSPQNIMVRLDGLTKVVDFGIAAAKDELGRRDHRQVQGKLRYLAPEELEGRPVDGRADQYALGVVLYELLTRTRPFSGRTPKEIVGLVLGGRLPPPDALDPTVAPELSAITMRMLRRQPKDRFPDLQAAADALRPHRDQGPPVEALLGRFATLLVGPEVQARSQQLTPEAVEIVGLLGDAERPCPSCGRRNALRDRYCRACGRALVEGAELTAPPSPAPDPGPARGELRRRLQASAQAAQSLVGAEARSVWVLAGAFEEGRRPRSPWQTTLESLARRPGTWVLRADETELLLVLGAVGLRLSAPEALAAAFGLESALQREGYPVSLVLSEGPAELSLHAERPKAQGPALAQAQSLLARARGLPGVYVTEALSRRIARYARLSTVRAPEQEGQASLLLCRAQPQDAVESPALPFLGRKEELIEAERRLLLVLKGQPQAWALAADPGLGKSALLQAIGRQAEQLGLLLLRIEGQDPRQAQSLWARAVQAALLALGQQEGPDLDPLELLGLEPALRRRLLRALGRSPIELDGEGTEPGLREDATWVRVLLRIADYQPLCLLIDDLHLLGGESIAAFDALSTRAQRGRIAAFATLDQAEQSSLGLTTLVHGLAPLADDKILALAAAHLGGPLPTAAAHLLLERADGSPSTALLLAETMLDLGGLAFQERRLVALPVLAELALPHRLEALVALRLDRLDKPTRDFLRVAAVAGPQFSVPWVGLALGLEDPAPLVAAAQAQRLLARGPSADGMARFAQPQIRQSLLDRLRTEDRARIHGRLAEVLAQADSAGAPGRAFAIAHHYFSAGRPREAIEAAWGGERSAGVLGLDSALRSALAADPSLVPQLSALAQRRLLREVLPRLTLRSLQDAEALAAQLWPACPDPDRGALLLLRAEIRRRLGRLGEASRDAEAARALAEPGLLSRVQLLQSAILEARGQLKEAAALLAEAADSAIAAPDEESGAGLANALGRLYFQLGQPDRAQPLFEDALAECVRRQDPERRAHVLINLAALAQSRGQAQTAAELLDEAARSAEEAADPLSLAKIAYNQGRLALASGEAARAKAALLLALETARAVGWQEGEALALESLRPL